MSLESDPFGFAFVLLQFVSEKRFNYSFITVFSFLSHARAHGIDLERKKGKEKDLEGKRSDFPSFGKFSPILPEVSFWPFLPAGFRSFFQLIVVSS